MSLIEYDSYEVRVFNRFSEIIFETNDVHQAWDGTHRKNGKMVQHGLYIYQITFRRADGEYQELRGHITLIR